MRIARIKVFLMNGEFFGWQRIYLGRDEYYLREGFLSTTFEEAKERIEKYQNKLLGEKGALDIRVYFEKSTKERDEVMEEFCDSLNKQIEKVY
ncbi:hypothetical protein J4225_02060 [Candidatus Pacearchaeota archaeon]|nr:hypothetical protein [Candidatus Pacearchaeota archaeon]